MIKTFISKTSSDNHLANFLKERLERENIGLDIFVWEERTRCGDYVQRMIDEVKRSIIFIPIISDASMEKDFVQNEIRTALDTPTVNIFPVKIDLRDHSVVPEGIRVAFQTSDQVQGRIWVDFTERSEWETKFEELREAIFNRLLELNLFRRDDTFYQDAEIIDVILSRPTPTAPQIKIMVDVYLKKTSFEEYFFRKLDDPNWLTYLYHYRFFVGNRNPRPVEVPEQTGYYSIPYWAALDYLERVAHGLSEHADEDTAQMLLKIVRSVSDYRDENSERIDNYRTDWVFVKIMAALPIEFVEVQDMDRIGVYLRSQWNTDLVAAEIGQSLLPKLLNEQAIPLTARLLGIVIDYEIRERNGRKELVPLVDEYWLNELMQNNKPAIRALFPLKAAGIVLDKIDQIVLTDNRQFNAVEILAVEDHHQNPFPTGYQNILVRAARDFLDSAPDKEPQETHVLLHHLLGREHPIFPRIALHVISTHWPKYSALFWPLLKSELLTNASLEHELYQLLKNNQAHFSQRELDKILDWIETREYWIPEDGFEDEEHEQRVRAFQKLEWLTALKESTYQKAIDKYEKYLALAGQEPEHPGFPVWMGEVQVGSISPIEVADLLQKDNKEIAKYLIDYRDEEKRYGKPSREGLADAFKTAVTNEPQKFSADLSPFLELPPYYLFYLLWGFKDAWDANRDFDWEAVLSFCLDLVQTDEFWTGPSKEDRFYPGSLVSRVADLIEVGTKDDSHAFSPSLLPQAEDLLLILMAKAESVLSQAPNLVTAVLNSPKGRVFAAAVNYSLRYARLRRDEEPAARWAPAIKEEFTRRLDRSLDPSIEFSVTLGEYLPNLAWLDRNWVITHLDEMFPKDNGNHWRGAMTGYFSLADLYRDLYQILRENGHYAKALETDFEDKPVRERLVQHLTVAYLNGVEGLADSESLFARLVTAWNPDDLRKIVSYLWMQRGALNAEQRSKVLSLWRYLFAHYHDKEELADDKANLASDLSKFAVYLDTIDPESLRWLLFSTPYVERNHNTWFFVECLDRLVSVSPHEVGLVYIQMLENGIYPDYDQAHITHTVETLYAEGEKELADRICNLYGSKRHYFLRDIYDRHRD